MYFKKRFSPVLLVFLLTFSMFSLAVPSYADSGVIEASEPGYFIPGADVLLPLCYLNGVELSQTGYFLLFFKSFGSWSVYVFVTPLVSVDVVDEDYTSYTDLTLTFAEPIDCWRFTFSSTSSSWNAGHHLPSSSLTDNFECFAGHAAYLNLPSDFEIPASSRFLPAASVSLGSPGFLNVFDEVISHVPRFFDSLIFLFVSPTTGLTTLGVLSLVSVFLGIFLLLFALLLKFLRFR